MSGPSARSRSPMSRNRGCHVHLFFHGNVNGDPFGHKMEQDTRWLFEMLRLGFACGKCDHLYHMNAPQVKVGRIHPSSSWTHSISLLVKSLAGANHSFIFILREKLAHSSGGERRRLEGERGARRVKRGRMLGPTRPLPCRDTCEWGQVLSTSSG